MCCGWIKRANNKEIQTEAERCKCHLKQTEPHSPWQNGTELTTREMKKGAGMTIGKSGVPKQLCDDCHELESYIHYNTALDIFMLGGEMPKNSCASRDIEY